MEGRAPEEVNSTLKDLKDSLKAKQSEDVSETVRNIMAMPGTQGGERMRRSTVVAVGKLAHDRWQKSIDRVTLSMESLSSRIYKEQVTVEDWFFVEIPELNTLIDEDYNIRKGGLFNRIDKKKSRDIRVNVVGEAMHILKNQHALSKYITPGATAKGIFLNVLKDAYLKEYKKHTSGVDKKGSKSIIETDQKVLRFLTYGVEGAPRIWNSQNPIIVALDSLQKNLDNMQKLTAEA